MTQAEFVGRFETEPADLVGKGVKSVQPTFPGADPYIALSVNTYG